MIFLPARPASQTHDSHKGRMILNHVNPAGRIKNCGKKSAFNICNFRFECFFYLRTVSWIILVKTGTEILPNSIAIITSLGKHMFSDMHGEFADKPVPTRKWSSGIMSFTRKFKHPFHNEHSLLSCEDYVSKNRHWTAHTGVLSKRPNLEINEWHGIRVWHFWGILNCLLPTRYVPFSTLFSKNLSFWRRGSSDYICLYSNQTPLPLFSLCLCPTLLKAKVIVVGG